MGSRQFGSRCRCGNGHDDLGKSIDPTMLEDYELEDLKEYKVRGIQFGTNPLVDSIVIGEFEGDPKKDDYTSPSIIGPNKGTPGLIVDKVDFWK